MRPALRSLWTVSLFLSTACSDDASPSATDATPAPDGGGGGATDAFESCPRAAAPADRTRKVVVGHPFVETEEGYRYEVLELDANGALQTTGMTFTLPGRATLGRVVFTPDGEVGLVADEDGHLGVFRFEDDGTPVVVESAFAGSFYAESVVMDPSGERAYVVDGDWREHGGGVYALRIGCDGHLADEGMLAAAKLPAALVLRGDRALLAAADVGASPAGDDAHVLAWSDTPTVLGGVDAFGDDDGIVADAVATADGRWFLLGDNNMYSGKPNRVAVVEVEGETLTARQILELEDPISLVAAPSGDSVFVASGFGDAAFALRREASGYVAREIEYQGLRPQLPGSAVLIDRGALTGRVLLAENVAVRMFAFEADGRITDLGATTVGDGASAAAITGAIGVQP